MLYAEWVLRTGSLRAGFAGLVFQFCLSLTGSPSQLSLNPLGNLLLQYARRQHLNKSLIDVQYPHLLRHYGRSGCQTRCGQRPYVSLNQIRHLGLYRALTSLPLLSVRPLLRLCRAQLQHQAQRLVANLKPKSGQH